MSAVWSSSAMQRAGLTVADLQRLALTAEPSGQPGGQPAGGHVQVWAHADPAHVGWSALVRGDHVSIMRPDGRTTSPVPFEESAWRESGWSPTEQSKPHRRPTSLRPGQRKATPKTDSGPAQAGAAESQSIERYIEQARRRGISG